MRRFIPAAYLIILAGCHGSGGSNAGADPEPETEPGPVRMRAVAELGAWSSIRIARNPVSGRLYVLQRDGRLLELQLSRNGDATVISRENAADTNLSAPQGMAFAPDGTLYLVGNTASSNNTVATIRRGIPNPGTDTHSWTTVAETVPYPRSGAFDHLFNGIAVSPDGQYLFVNSGARTDHGEVQSGVNGNYPGLREVPLTAKILRLPADATDIVLPNDEADLIAGGYLYASGVRNTFDLAFSADGNLFGVDNSGDRDDEDELNWIREGHHYGFPWRMGTHNTPQQFAGYDPDDDLLINHAYQAWQQGLFYNDPGYPAAPAVTFTDPIANHGPDANSYRNANTGVAAKASDRGRTTGTFTPHRSPLGLVFDTGDELPEPFRGAAFVLSWTGGYSSGRGGQGPFLDLSQDMLHLELTPTADSYRTTATRIICGLRNPMDAEIIDGRFYILELGGSGQVWEAILPSRKPDRCTTVPRSRAG